MKEYIVLQSEGQLLVLNVIMPLDPEPLSFIDLTKPESARARTATRHAMLLKDLFTKKIRAFQNTPFEGYQPSSDMDTDELISLLILVLNKSRSRLGITGAFVRGEIQETCDKPRAEWA